MHEYEYEEIEPVGPEEAEPCGNEFPPDNWNEMVAGGIGCQGSEVDLVELLEEGTGLRPDEDLPEMADIIRNIWD